MSVYTVFRNFSKKGFKKYLKDNANEVFTDALASYLLYLLEEDFPVHLEEFKVDVVATGMKYRDQFRYFCANHYLDGELDSSVALPIWVNELLTVLAEIEPKPRTCANILSILNN